MVVITHTLNPKEIYATATVQGADSQTLYGRP